MVGRSYCCNVVKPMPYRGRHGVEIHQSINQSISEGSRRTTSMAEATCVVTRSIADRFADTEKRKRGSRPYDEAVVRYGLKSNGNVVGLRELPACRFCLDTLTKSVSFVIPIRSFHVLVELVRVHEIIGTRRPALHPFMHVLEVRALVGLVQLYRRFSRAMGRPY